MHDTVKRGQQKEAVQEENSVSKDDRGRSVDMAAKKKEGSGERREERDPLNF